MKENSEEGSAKFRPTAQQIKNGAWQKHDENHFGKGWRVVKKG